MNITKMKSGLLVAAAMLAGSQAFAAGFEKGILWGARSAGVGGIATPYITGSQALYFNPAGLVADKPGHDVSLNITPTWPKFSGPINYQNDSATSTSPLTTPFALLYSGTIDKDFGFGIGGYTAGGSIASFENVPFPGTSAGTANVKTDLRLNELGVGAGYRISDALKVGLTWRILMGSADFSFVQPILAPSAPNTTTSGMANLDVNGIKTTNFTGFKLGGQYRLTERTMLGLTYRSEVEIKGDGTYGGRVSNPAAPAAPIAIDNKTATARTVLPMQVNLGATHDYEKWRSLLEYSWTQYSRVGEIVVEGPVTANGNPISPTSSQGVRLNTQWRDQHQVRIGGEYMGWAYPLRVGYNYTSPVTNASFARAQFTPPGSGHTLTAGTGQSFDVMGSPLQADIAAEYTFASGDSDGGVPAGQTYDANNGYTRQGTFKASAYALHLGVGYSF